MYSVGLSTESVYGRRIQVMKLVLAERHPERFETGIERVIVATSILGHELNVT